MFLAVITICFNFADKCIDLKDTNGPYYTILECEARSEEMVRYLRNSKNIPEFKLAHKACLTVDRKKA